MGPPCFSNDSLRGTRKADCGAILTNWTLSGVNLSGVGTRLGAFDDIVASSPEDSFKISAGGVATIFVSVGSGIEVPESGSSEDLPISSSSEACNASS